MMESSFGMTQDVKRATAGRDTMLQPSPGSLSGIMIRADHLHGDRPRGIGAFASTIRDTVYTMVDALRGRYDC